MCIVFRSRPDANRASYNCLRRQSRENQPAAANHPARFSGNFSIEKQRVELPRRQRKHRPSGGGEAGISAAMNNSRASSNEVGDQGSVAQRLRERRRLLAERRRSLKRRPIAFAPRHIFDMASRGAARPNCSARRSQTSLFSHDQKVQKFKYVQKFNKLNHVF